MKVLFIARATLYSVYGGDTVQILSTAKYLAQLGVAVDIKLSAEKIDYSPYDLIHFFNIIRPADALHHAHRARKPYLVSTIFVDYSEYERYADKGIRALLGKLFSGDQMEYIKTIARRLKNGERIGSWQYILRGHRHAVRSLARGATMLLPNSESEYSRFTKAYDIKVRYKVVYNGIDPDIFTNRAQGTEIVRDAHSILCVARIEGKKNQLNLIRALNGGTFTLTLIGKVAPNHQGYNQSCRDAAGPNIHFVDFMPQEQLSAYYRKARVHVLPSWNETTGLSSLEAAWYGCSLVITDKGDTKEYFGEEAFYCDPADPASIAEAIKKASEAAESDVLKEKIQNQYNWAAAAASTLMAYKQVLAMPYNTAQK